MFPVWPEAKQTKSCRRTTSWRPVAKVVRRSWNSVVVLTGRVVVQWARESNDGRRMMRAAAESVKAAFCVYLVAERGRVLGFPFWVGGGGWWQWRCGFSRALTCLRVICGRKCDKSGKHLLSRMPDAKSEPGKAQR